MVWTKPSRKQWHLMRPCLPPTTSTNQRMVGMKIPHRLCLISEFQNNLEHFVDSRRHAETCRRSSVAYSRSQSTLSQINKFVHWIGFSVFPVSYAADYSDSWRIYFWKLITNLESKLPLQSSYTSTRASSSYIFLLVVRRIMPIVINDCIVRWFGQGQ